MALWNSVYISCAVTFGGLANERPVREIYPNQGYKLYVPSYLCKRLIGERYAQTLALQDISIEYHLGSE